MANTFFNIQTGLYMDECDFFALVMGTDYGCCNQHRNVWIGQPLNEARNEYQWQVYFTANPPECGGIPVNLTVPVISGTIGVGQVLTTTDGTWTNSPTSYSYQWYSGGNPVGSNDPFYLIEPVDVCEVITVEVTATNAHGSSLPAISAAFLIATTPVNTVAPSVSGTAQYGNLLTATTGTWTAVGSLSYAYQWRKAGVDIVGATSSTYTTVSGDACADIDCVVTATACGTLVGTPEPSSNSISVTDNPVNTVLPLITGTNSVGSTLTCSDGTWTSATAITYTYQWRLNGSNIGGATNSTYVLQSGDAGGTVDCRVTATSSCGATTVTSSNSYAVPAPLLLDGYATNTAYGWSVARALKGSATAIIRVRRSNDNAELDFGRVSSVDPSLDTASLLSWVGSNSAFITTIYEQNGSGYNLTQTTAGSQPRIVNAGTLEVLNGKPCGAKPAGTMTMTVPSSTSYFKFLHDGTLSSVFCVCSFGDVFGNTFYQTQQGSNPGIQCYRFSASTAYTVITNNSNTVATTTPANLTDGAQYLLTSYIDAGNATAVDRLHFYVNGGAVQKNNAATNAPSSSNSAQNLGFNVTSASTKYQELIILPSQPTLSTFRNDINGFYSIY